MSSGWSVRVETNAGPVFYAVALPKPYDAEDLVRSSLSIPKVQDVVAFRRLDEVALRDFGVASGGVVGPF